MIFCIIGFIYALFILPELKGLSLEEIDAVFKDTAGREDAERRERVAKQVGLDKLANQVVHKETGGGTAGQVEHPMTGEKRLAADAAVV